MDDVRANPEELLKLIQSEKEDRQQGRLKIFFGYAAGVGKTYAMLKAAHDEKQSGTDVIIGYIEPHARPETAALVHGLEALPVKELQHSQITLSELDLDLAIERKPQLILVDELAHTNAPGCRHEKRYQDVEELLKAGIDVFTTVNVQHIESLNDMVAAITGVMVRERIPDKVFDHADQVELVDIEPQDLIKRLNAGKIYREQQVQKALTNFFNIDNLIALREIALRRCADRINLLSETNRLRRNNEYFTGEHILVCLSSSPTNAKIIRTAARMASAFRAHFTALFVENTDFPAMSEENKKRLRANIHLAQQLGATIEATFGDDVAFQISEFARLSGVSKIVVGRNNAKRKFFFSKASLTEKLTSYSPNLDIYIIPDKDTPLYRPQQLTKQKNQLRLIDLVKSLGIICGATVIGFLFYSLGFSEANIITIYILGVLMIAVVTTQRIYSLVSSVVSVLVFNYFFTIPRFSLHAYDSGYPATFLIMFIAAFITGTLAVKIKQNAKQAAQTAYRTKILLDTNQLLQQAKDKDSIITVSCWQLTKLLNKSILFYPSGKELLEQPRFFAADTMVVAESIITENEKAVAAWTFKNNKRAGATTNTLANSRCLNLAVRVNNTVYGVVGIVMDSTPLDAFENSIVLSILGECALALENNQVAKEKQQAAVLAKNEQLRANLLRSISHDLRTPLTSISGNAGILLSSENALNQEKRRQLISDIYDDSIWLINLIENLLAVTRIEDGTMHLRLTGELIDEVIQEALHHVSRRNIQQTIVVKQPEELIMAKMDAKLIIQVLVNLIDNAIKYTPASSTITLQVINMNDTVQIEVLDDGPGISDEDKPHIFDMFYTSINNKIVDSRRSLGLGLALCKSIISAHGGEIIVYDNVPNGTIFCFTLPTQEVHLNE